MENKPPRRSIAATSRTIRMDSPDRPSSCGRCIDCCDPQSGRRGRGWYLDSSTCRCQSAWRPTYADELPLSSPSSSFPEGTWARWTFVQRFHELGEPRHDIIIGDSATLAVTIAYKHTRQCRHCFFSYPGDCVPVRRQLYQRDLLPLVRTRLCSRFVGLLISSIVWHFEACCSWCASIYSVLLEDCYSTIVMPVSPNTLRQRKQCFKINTAIL